MYLKIPPSLFQVLQSIFSSLHLSDLKSVRLVCNFWNDHSGLVALGKKGYLNLKKTWPCCQISDPPEFDTALAKRVKVTARCRCAGSDHLVDAALTENFSSFVSPIKEIVEEMVLEVDLNFLAFWKLWRLKISRD